MNCKFDSPKNIGNMFQIKEKNCEVITVLLNCDMNLGI